VKVELQKIYDRLKISKKAKATDLEEYFTVELKRIGTTNNIILKKHKS
jgi:hypothetical protein